MFFQMGGGGGGGHPGMGGGGDMDDMIAQMMFGGGMHGRGQPRRRRGRDEGLGYPVSLEDLYNGKTVSIPREKTVVEGNGPNVRIKQVKAPLKVTIEKGMEHEDQIRFRGEGDEHPQIDVPGDVVIVLQQEKHDVFKRDDADLIIKKDITLAEALCGFQFEIEHLDKRKLVVRSEPNMIIKPGMRKCIAGEGMPVKGEESFGDLIVEFKVIFPDRMELSAIDLLKDALPAPKPLQVDYNADEAETVFVDRQSLDEVRHEIDQEEDDDDGAGPGGPGVQCAQQ